MLTDNNPLTYVLTTAKLDATGHQWRADLSLYDFSIKYRPGLKNGDADWLLQRSVITENEVQEPPQVGIIQVSKVKLLTDKGDRMQMRLLSPLYPSLKWERSHLLRNILV